MSETTALTPPTSATILPPQPQPVRSATHISPWQRFDLTDDRLKLLRKQIAPSTATDVEFEFFVEWCRQTGLNPFLKQAYLIERWDAQANTRRHEPMVAEAGFAARADALPDFRGMRSGVVYAGDVFGVIETTGEVVHEWTLAERAKAGHRVLGAWAHGVRDGRIVEVTWLPLESRIAKKKDGSPTIFWARDPGGQIRKCARADQYRRMYANIFAGWYHPAESRVVEGGTSEEAAVAPVLPGPSAKSAALKERLAKMASTPAASEKSVPEAKPAASGTPPLTHLRFGPAKGTAIADASTIELLEAASVARKNLAECKGTEPWVQSVREGLDAVDAEITAREGSSQLEVEPGSEG